MVKRIDNPRIDMEKITGLSLTERPEPVQGTQLHAAGDIGQAATIGKLPVIFR